MRAKFEDQMWRDRDTALFVGERRAVPDILPGAGRVLATAGRLPAPPGAVSLA